MPVVPIYLNIDDKTYQGIKAGTLELYGLAKNANTKEWLNIFLQWLMQLKKVHQKLLILFEHIKKEPS